MIINKKVSDHYDDEMTMMVKYQDYSFFKHHYNYSSFNDVWFKGEAHD